ncbi:hypothetical protein CHCC20335_3767 [Bacillus paralicheniformis]|nr:hypothetical protein CHCC20335_3767 [Bacillus paralicheniformis]
MSDFSRRFFKQTALIIISINFHVLIFISYRLVFYFRRFTSIVEYETKYV